MEKGSLMKKKIIGIVGACFLSLLIAACGKTTEEKWQEQYDLGQQYLLEENYEEAIVAFTAAIEIEPKEIQAYTGLIQAYWQAGDSGNADSIIQSGIGILTEEGKQHSQDMQIEFFLTAKEFYEENGNREKLTQILEFLKELEPDNEEYQRLLDENAATLSFMEKHPMLLQELAQSCQREDDEAIWELILSDEFHTAISDYNEEEGRVVYPLGFGKALALVEYGRVYYGSIKDGLRSGDGILYDAYGTKLSKNNKVYDGYCYWKFDGTWSQDLAEGQGTLQQNVFYEEGLFHRLECSGEYTADKENGSRVFKYTDEDGTRTFYYTAENGQAVPVGVSESGMDIVAYAEEINESYLCLEGELSRLFNIRWQIN